MSTTANVRITGTLSNLTRRHDGGVDATLTHPEVQVAVTFPADLAHLVTAGDRVTVHGNDHGPGILAVTVEAAR